ncbi:hypothetical protein RUM43_006725 [Polyplax serrata]|uniref:Uncharacterized protein n=1 Tax=Polyplax serrata TaxID=468196 RepID=A0AAN8PFC0_POLSC
MAVNPAVATHSGKLTALSHVTQTLALIAARQTSMVCHPAAGPPHIQSAELDQSLPERGGGSHHPRAGRMIPPASRMYRHEFGAELVGRDALKVLRAHQLHQLLLGSAAGQPRIWPRGADGGRGQRQ